MKRMIQYKQLQGRQIIKWCEYEKWADKTDFQLWPVLHMHDLDLMCAGDYKRKLHLDKLLLSLVFSEDIMSNDQ